MGVLTTVCSLPWQHQHAINRNVNASDFCETKHVKWDAQWNEVLSFIILMFVIGNCMMSVNLSSHLHLSNQQHFIDDKFRCIFFNENFWIFNMILLKCGPEGWNDNTSLQWRHSGHDSISNHQPHDCFLNRWFRCKWKKTSKLSVTGLCAGNSLGTGEFLAQMASCAKNVSIWWRHHVNIGSCDDFELNDLQAITCDQDLCGHMMSQDHNEWQNCFIH